MLGDVHATPQFITLCQSELYSSDFLIAIGLGWSRPLIVILPKYIGGPAVSTFWAEMGALSRQAQALPSKLPDLLSGVLTRGRHEDLVLFQKLNKDALVIGAGLL